MTVKNSFLQEVKENLCSFGPQLVEQGLWLGSPRFRFLTTVVRNCYGYK